MARPTNTTRQFDLLLSRASQQRLEAFQNTLEKSAETIGSMKQDLKNLADAGKALKMAELSRRPGALDNSVRLQGVGAKRDVAMQASNEARMYEQAAKSVSRINDLELARGRTLRNNLGEIAKIRTIEEATAKIRAADLRVGMAIIENDKRKLTTAQALKANLESRLQTLKAEQAQVAQIAKDEEKRAAAAMKARLQPLNDMAGAARSRRQSEQRVLGDGGASLFRIQTGLLANYAILNTIQTGFAGAVQGVVEFDNSLRNLQAIVSVTDGNMVGLRESILQTAESTRFTATEVADAAVLLGQAGLSGAEIDKALQSVAELATATGTDLAKAVDTATAILGAFNLEATRMAEVSNTLTQALNLSKLDMEKLTLGIQYAGNTAYDAGVSFEELTAGLGAMANAGIRSGSTLGTGMRQILVSLEKPSESFTANLEKLGLTTYDVNLKTKGLAGVMRTLKDAGFSASDAIESFEVRSAAAFIALSNNLELMSELETSFVGSTAAAQANDTQMRSLKAQYDNFTGALQAVIAEGMQPITLAIRDGLIELNKWFQALRQNGEELRKWGIIIAQVIAAIAAFKTLSLLTNIVISFATSIGGLVTTLSAATFAFRAFAAGAATAGESMAFLSAGGALLAPSIALVVAAIGALAAVYYTGTSATSAYEKEQSRLTDQMDRVKTAIEKTKGVLDSYKAKMGEVDDKLQQLANRQNELKGDSKLLSAEIERVRRQFAGMGYNVSTVDSTVGNLIAKLQALRAQLAQDYTLAVNVQIGNLAALRGLQNANILSEINNIGGILSDSSGVFNDTLSSGQSTAIKDLQAAARGGDPAQIAAATLRVQQEQEAAIAAASAYTPPDPANDTISNRGQNEIDRANAAAAQQQADALSKALASSLNIQSSQQVLRDLGLEEVALKDSAVTETQKGSTYSGTFERVAAYPEQINSDLAAIEKATRGKPTDRMQAFMAYETTRGGELDSAIAAVKADKTLTEANRSELIGDLEAAKGQLAEARQKYEPEAFVAKEGVIESDIRLQSRGYGDAMDRIGGADDVAQANDAANVARTLAERQFRLNEQRLLLRVPGNDPLNADASTQNQLNLAEEEYQRQLDEIDNALQEKTDRLNKPDTGGGSADSGAGREFNLMMDDFKTGMTDAEQDFKYGETTGPEAVGRMDQIIAKAREELEVRRQLMMEQAQGSAEYNRLKSEEKTLLGFIREEEEKIRKLKEEQGLAQINLTKTVQEWANQNLNIAKTLEEGIGSVLSTMKEAFATLFTDLANGTKSAKDAFKDFALSVVKSIQSVIAEMLAMYVMQQLIGFIFPSGSTGFGGFARNFAGLGKMTGGEVKRMAGGGVARDSVPAMLMPGEYVLRKSAVDMIGVDNLDAMNRQGNAVISNSGHQGVAKPKDKAPAFTNVYVVSPDQQPVPGPSDIIAVINDDIARGGSTKRLIKTVAMGF